MVDQLMEVKIADAAYLAAFFAFMGSHADSSQIFKMACRFFLRRLSKNAGEMRLFREL